MLKTPELFSQGTHLSRFALSEDLRACVLAENWDRLDAEFRKWVEPDGAFFQFLHAFHEFTSIDFIISIRDSKNEWEEDGIWHDDGTRVFAFSISFTLDTEKLEGGHLEIRRKESEVILSSIPTPAFGDVILFLTGVHGFEHRTRQVLKGRRVIIAGWCS